MLEDFIRRDGVLFEGIRGLLCVDECSTAKATVGCAKAAYPVFPVVDNTRVRWVVGELAV